MKNDNKSRSIYSKRQIKRINDKINLLGVSSKYSTLSFLNIRLITSIMIFLFILFNYKYGYIFRLLLLFCIIISLKKYFLMLKLTREEES